MKKIVSLRINEKVLKTLDERMNEFPYWKKHAVMCAILENVLLNAEPRDLSTIVRHNSRSLKQLIIKASEQPEKDKQ